VIPSTENKQKTTHQVVCDSQKTRATFRKHDWCETDHSSNQVFANRALVSCQPVPRRCITVAILPPFVLEKYICRYATMETEEYFRKKTSAFERSSELLKLLHKLQRQY